MLDSAEFWVFLSFLCFILLFGRRIRDMAWRFLDARRAVVVQDLERAARIVKDAEELLAVNQRRFREAGAEVDQILAQAHMDARRLREEAEEMLREERTRKLAHIELQGQQMRAQLDHDLNISIIETAITAASRLAAEQLDQQADTDLIRLTLQESSLPVSPE